MRSLSQQPHVHFGGASVGEGVVGDEPQGDRLVVVPGRGVEGLRSGGAVTGGSDAGQQECPVRQGERALGIDGKWL